MPHGIQGLLQILGVERGATQDDIKRAYRKHARTYHPDVNKEAGAEAKFKDAGEAYEVLKDPEKRAAYDQLGANWQQGQEFRPPPNWDAGFEFSGGGYTGADAAQFSDFFEGLFGRARAGGGRGGFAGHREFHAQGEDHHAKVVIDLRDAYTGAKRSITLRVPEVDDSGHVILKDRTLSVTIPKGIREGQHIRLAGQGAPGIGKGPPGDLYLEVAFAPDPLFRVEGKDVYLDLPVTPWEAALGASVKAPDSGRRRDAKDTTRLDQGSYHAPQGKRHPRLAAGRPARRAKDRAAAGRYRQGERHLPANGARVAVQSARQLGSVRDASRHQATARRTR
ncbi:MAG: DnaJ domain-containing protein [Hyphomicrobium sp.]|nr:DnaJ domain-containing protein [Hyphomicrobium sp.]